MLTANNPVVSKKLNCKKFRTGFYVQGNEVATNVEFHSRYIPKRPMETYTDMNDKCQILPIEMSSSEHHSVTQSFIHSLIHLFS